MLVVMAIIQTLPQHTEAFFKAQVENSEASVRDEPGCMDFHVLRGTGHGVAGDFQTDEGDRSRMVVYEVFQDWEAFEAHMQAPHYLKFHDAVQGMYAAPVEGYYFENVFPDDSYFSK